MVTAVDLPRERLLLRGAEALSTAELLAVCLGTGAPGEDALTLARRLLDQFAGVEALLAAPVSRLLSCRGLGLAKVARLKALLELSLRESEDLLTTRGFNAEAYTDSQMVCRYIRRRIGHGERETFGCMFLNARHRLLRWEVLFQGSIDRAHVHAREVLKRAMELNAAALVFGHNHPSGVAEPSQADVLLTRELRELLARVDINLLDHVVVAPNDTISFAARGLL
jgi:DNA repair protein RadC